MPTTAATLLASLADLSVSEFPSLDSALRLYCATAMRLVGVRGSFVARIRGDELEVVAATDDAGCGVTAGDVVPLHATLCQFPHASAAPVIIDDATNDPRAHAFQVCSSTMVGAYLGVPIIFSNGTPYGTFCVLDPQPFRFEKPQRDFMRLAARQLGAVLERAPAASQRNQGLTQAASIPTARVEHQRVLHTVIHDLRSPLTGVMGGCELLNSRLFGPLTDDQHEIVAQVYRTSQLMNRLVNDLFDAASNAERQVSVVLTPLDPVALAQQALVICRPSAAQRGLRLELESAPDVPMLLSDGDRVLQVLLNLLRNAVQYTVVGGVVLRVAAVADEIEFRIDDTGPGIDLAVQATIWQAFTRATTEGVGHGLGLAIVQQLVRLLHGRVGVDSVPGQGSSFWVRLPRHGPSLS